MCSRLPGALLIKSGLGCDESKTRTSDRNRERSDEACCAFLPTRTTESRKQSQKALKGRCSRRNVLSLGCPNARPIADVPWNNIPDDREFSRNTRNRDSTRKSSLQSRPGCSAKRSPSQLPSNQVLLRRKRTWAWTPPSHGSKSGIEACGPTAAQLLHKCCKWGYVGILQLRAARGPRARIAQELRTILSLDHTVPAPVPTAPLQGSKKPSCVLFGLPYAWANGARIGAGLSDRDEPCGEHPALNQCRK